MLILTGSGCTFKKRGILLGSLENVEPPNVFSGHGRFLMYLQALAGQAWPLWLCWPYAQGPSHSKPHCTDTLGETGHCINRAFHISKKFCIYFLCFSPSKSLLYFPQWETAFSQFCSNLRLSRKPCLASSPSARVSLCMPSLQQTLPFLQPQQVGWAVTFQGCKGLTKSVLWELLEFCFGHWSKSQHNIWPER